MTCPKNMNIEKCATLSDHLILVNECFLNMDIMKVRSSLSICDCIFHFELNIIM